MLYILLSIFLLLFILALICYSTSSSQKVEEAIDINNYEKIIRSDGKSPVKIAFHIEFFGLTGTFIAIYDYAKYNKDILNNESIIISKSKVFEGPIFEKFKNEFGSNIYSYDSMEDLENMIEKMNIDIFYFLSGFTERDIKPNNVFLATHGVFSYNERKENVAHSFAVISDTVREDKILNVVPHMVHLPEKSEDYRKKYNISKDYTVLGILGGFGFEGSEEVVMKCLEERKDLFIIRAGEGDLNHERTKSFGLVVDLQEKSNFICACDGMLHLRKAGETFGLACGEFGFHGKPVITYNSKNREHIKLLRDQAIIYNDLDELRDIIMKFKPISHFDNPALYRTEYNPEKVMKKFNRIFIKPYRKLCLSYHSV